MKTWINTQLEILKRKAIKLGKLLLALLVIYLTVAYDAFWIALPTLAVYHLYMIPTYKKRYLDKEHAKFEKHLASIDPKYTKVEFKNRFGLNFKEYEREVKI